MEKLCLRRALEAFGLDGNEWGVNVQGDHSLPEFWPVADFLEVLSGSLANVFSYIALMEPGDTVMGLELSHGGHISHGYQTPTKKISETAIRFQSVPYHVDVETGLVDYEGLETLAERCKPRIITVGGSAYSRLIDFERVRRIADRTASLVHCDMAHFCGLVAAAVIPSPFPYCDLVTTTTNKTFRGPNSAMIFFRKWMEERINRTVFPRFQAGTHSGYIIALAVGLLQAQSTESKSQQRKVVQAAQVLAGRLIEHGYQLLGGGTDTHLLVLDLRRSAIEGNRVEKILELVHVYCNRNTIPSDKAGGCSGIRLGTAAMVARGMDVQQFVQAGDLIHQGIEITKQLSKSAIERAETLNEKNPRGFRVFLEYVGNGNNHEAITKLRDVVKSVAQAYPPPWN